jgi:uncharacterized protein YndB with AHSA1/START domain
MPIEACPSDTFHATADRIWDALTIPSRLAGWIGAKTLNDPGRRLEAGDHLVLGIGLSHWIKIYFDMLKAEQPTELRFDVHLPLGIVIHEVIRVTPISSSECRVTFN